MPQTNSLGAAPLKNRTINVEVNLLGEWLDSRAKLHDDRLRWTGFLTTVALIAVVALPLLSEAAAAQRNRVRRAESMVGKEAASLAALETQLAEVQPKLDSEATQARCQAQATVFMGEILTVLNSTTPKMAVETIEGSVLGGEVTIKTKAQAETYLDAQEFVGIAGRGNRVKSAILSTARQNRSLSPDGVTFEFAKKVEVGQ